MSVYQPCDIRGPVTDLTPELYRRWGEALAAQVAPGAAVYVGGDVRTTTPAFLESLAQSLRAGGARVLNLGVVPTPMAYFAQRRRGAAACAIVTASHNPPAYNGLEWMIGDRPPTEADVERLRRHAEGPLAREAAPLGPPIEAVSVEAEYADWLAGTFTPVFAGKIAVDPGNGCWSGRAASLLRRVHPRAAVVSIHDRPDGTFPERDPDSAKPANLKSLAETVVREGADIGIAFDGDGDRAAFVDAEGHALSAEEATWCLIESYGAALRGQAFVYDIKFSDAIPDAAKRYGGRPCVERSGHAFIRARMLREDALFGAEISGHFFYRELRGGDDGMYSALRLLARLAQTRRTLADLRKGMRPIHVTPDLRVTVAGDRGEIIARVREAFRDRPQSAVDGVRVEFPGRGWALVRGSVTEPAVTLRFEGESAAALIEVIAVFCAPLGEFGERVRQKCEAGGVFDDPGAKR